MDQFQLRNPEPILPQEQLEKPTQLKPISRLKSLSGPGSALYADGYRYQRSLGEGGFGEVALFKKANRNYAIKLIDPTRMNMTSAESVKFIDKEIANTQQILENDDRCGIYSNFVLKYSHRKAGGRVFFISEAMDADLEKFLVTDSDSVFRRTPEYQELVLAIVCQLFYAVECLHKIGLIHGDLKPNNILINGHTGQIKLADFGGSASLEPVPSHTPPEMQTRVTSSTNIYLPPELQGQSKTSFKATTKTDIWSLGLIILFLVAKNPRIVHQNLGKLNQTQIDQIINQEIETREELDSELKRFYQQLLNWTLQVSSARRKSLKQIMTDPLFIDRCNLFVKSVKSLIK